MKRKSAVLGLLAAALATTVFAAEGPVPKGVKDLDHVFLIMMENHGYSQIIGNPNAPFINQLANSAGYATNYFAVGHPSLTNYLEVVGGSNFGVRSDNYPDWYNLSCKTNVQTGLPNADIATPNGQAPVPVDTSAVICPIRGSGKDAATPAIDSWNENNPPVFNF